MRFIGLFLSVTLLLSCTNYRLYQKTLKSTDPDFQFSQAVSYFNNHDYVKSMQLFEDLLTEFKGHESAESIYYYYIYSNFHLKDYTSTIYHAKNFITRFVLSEKAEEITFLAAYCTYLESPRASLDQEKTHIAIDELELFLTKYPTSDSLHRVNSLIFELNKKLEKKYFENSQLYFDTGKYKAAIFAIDHYLLEYPESSFREQITFIQLKAYYELGKNSVDEKKQQRIKEAIFACNNFYKTFESSNYNDEVTKIMQELKKIQNGL